VKKEILRLTETYIKRAEDLEAINANFIPPLFDAILGDYTRNVPQARDAEVLNVVAAIVTRLGVSVILFPLYDIIGIDALSQSMLTVQIPPVLDAVFEPTLEMINKDFTEFPEHRGGLYRLLRAINSHCFPGKSDWYTLRCYTKSVICLSPSQHPSAVVQDVYRLYYLGYQAHHARHRRSRSHLFVSTIHTLFSFLLTNDHHIVCIDVINNFASAAEKPVSNAFFQAFYIPLLQDTFFVLTDADHKSGFKLQSVLLMRLVQLVESNTVDVPLYNPADVTDPSMTNQVYVRQYTANLLQSAFPHVST
jgi:exportin-1